MSASLKIHGVRELLAQLTKLQEGLAVKNLAASARAAFKPVLDAAKVLAPRDSGELADSLKLRVVKGKEGVIKVGIMVGKSTKTRQAALAAAAFGEAQTKRLPAARRWHFVELGTSHQAAHPFLRPALDANASAVLEILKVELRKRILEATK